MSTKASTITRREQLLVDALEVIEAEHGAALELDEVARRIAVSRRHLQRVFVEIHGEPYRSVLTKTRLRHAAELLSDPENRDPIHTIAHAVGYREPAQFAKAFRREHGVTPSSFRGDVRLRRVPQSG